MTSEEIYIEIAQGKSTIDKFEQFLDMICAENTYFVFNFVQKVIADEVAFHDSETDIYQFLRRFEKDLLTKFDEYERPKNAEH